MRDDVERLRRDDEEFAAELANRVDPEPGASTDFVGIVSSDGSFPTVAGRVYKVIPQRVSGTETEGQTASYSASAAPIYAANVGPNVPTNGTSKVLCVFVSDRWVFEF